MEIDFKTFSSECTCMIRDTTFGNMCQLRPSNTAKVDDGIAYLDYVYCTERECPLINAFNLFFRCG